MPGMLPQETYQQVALGATGLPKEESVAEVVVVVVVEVVVVEKLLPVVQHCDDKEVKDEEKEGGLLLALAVGRHSKQHPPEWQSSGTRRQDNRGPIVHSPPISRKCNLRHHLCPFSRHTQCSATKSRWERRQPFAHQLAEFQLVLLRDGGQS